MASDSASDPALQRVHSFVERVLAEIEHRQDLDDAVRLAQWLALYLWENACGIYRLDRIEEIIASKCQAGLPDIPDEPSQAVELHVASKVFRSGGHTPLMRCLMHESRQPVAALLTQSDQADECAQILAVPPSAVTVTPAHLSALDRVAFLARAMLRHQRVCLHIHPHDVICAVATRVAKSIRPTLDVHFVNHADHVFSVGLATADHVLEISAYGWMLRDRRGVTDRSSFIGIPISQPAHQAAALPDANRFILTGGASYKFRPLGNMSLPRALAAVLQADSSLGLTVLGASSKDWWWWPLRLRYRKRVTLLKSVPKERYRQYLATCSLYVDSYPWLGGTAFPEALMMGCRVAGMTGVAWGYSVADLLRSDNPTSFAQDCRGLLSGQPALLKHQQDVRAQCLAYHAPGLIRQRLDQLILTGQPVMPPAELLTRPPVAHAEKFWRQQGLSVLPPRKKTPLIRDDLKLLHRLHGQSFGWLTWPTMKLGFYAYFKKLD